MRERTMYHWVNSHGDKFETKVTKWQGLREPTQWVKLIMVTLLDTNKKW